MEYYGILTVKIKCLGKTNRKSQFFKTIHTAISEAIIDVTVFTGQKSQ